MPNLTKRLAVFTYGLISYAIFFVTFLYMIGFLGNFGVPKSIDGPATTPIWLGLLVNVGLVMLFALQHSIMARPAFKKWWTKYIPEPAERSTYVLASSIALILLMAYWEPLGGLIWDVQDETARLTLYSAYAAGWGIILASTYLIDHFDLFGLRQVTLFLRALPYSAPAFKTPRPYLHVRHPLYIGWLTTFWATPTMTMTHLFFALTTTIYILVAIRYEERDLSAEHGPIYDEYRKRVPMLIPSLKPFAVGAGDTDASVVSASHGVSCRSEA